MSVEIAKHLFTVEQYERMIETGILTKYYRVELIEGEIVEMSRISPLHAACVNRLNMLVRKFSRGATVGVKSPVMLVDNSETKPDLSLLKWRDDFYGHSRPTPDDVLLLIEVSDATLKYDRQVKMPLYARAGIEELWVVNLQDDEVEV